MQIALRFARAAGFACLLLGLLAPGCGSSDDEPAPAADPNAAQAYELLELEVSSAPAVPPTEEAPRGSSTLWPAFAPGTYDYVVGPAPLAPTVSIRAVPVDGDAELFLDGVLLDAGEWSAPFTIGIGITTRTLEVRTQYRIDYEIQFHRTRMLTLDAILGPEVYGGEEDRAWFGSHLAAYGSTLAVGAQGADLVYVYETAGGGWTVPQVLEGPDRNGSFPTALALGADALFVGDAVAGEVTVYGRSGPQWVPLQVLAEGPATGGFGQSVAVHGDRLVVGAPLEDAGTPGVDLRVGVGAAYVYVWDLGGWMLDERLPSPATSDDMQFGSAVALDADRLFVAAVGDRGEQAGINPSPAPGPWPSGAVYAYQRAATWAQTHFIKASGVVRFAQFGAALHATADSLVVGAPGENAVYLFHTGAGGIGQDQRLVAGGPGGDRMGEFGAAVSQDDVTLLCGAPRQTPADPALIHAGIAHVLRPTGTTSELLEYSQSVVVEGGGLYGWAVAHLGSMIIVGAPGEGYPDRDGRVHVWR